MGRSSKPTLRKQLESAKSELKAEKDKGASFHFNLREIELMKAMCANWEEFLKDYEEGSLNEIGSCSKDFKNEEREIVRGIYNKITFK
jgi:hypothetical protein